MKYTRKELDRASKLAEKNRVPLSGLQIQAYRALENATFTPNAQNPELIRKLVKKERK